MKKVIILSYYYPPSNFTAGNRIFSWVKYLPKHGIKPIVVTRNYDTKPNNYLELAASSGNEDWIIENKSNEIHYLKFKGTLRDKIFSKYGNTRFVFTRKILTIFELLLRNYFFFDPINKQFFDECSKIIEKQEVNKIIVSVHPFQQLRIVYLLKKKYPKINLIIEELATEEKIKVM